MSVRFAIVSMGRTGSTYLVGLLDSHPQIECRGELFGPGQAYEKSGLSEERFLAEAAFETDLPARGFKMPYDWILEYPKVIGILIEMDFRIIRLTRKNLLDHMVSSYLAGVNKDWSSKAEYKIQSLEITPYGFLDFASFSKNTDILLDKLFSRNPYFHLDYEDISDTAKQRDLLDFLDAPGRALRPSTIKARTEPLHRVISNYAELAAFFADSPYRYLFPAAP